jgi:hypothetical protein
MADPLSYIRIAGLEADAEECFQGMTAGSASGGGSGTGSGGTPSTSWLGFPEEAIAKVLQYTSDLNTWLQSAADYTPSSRGDVLEVLPAIPDILSTVGTGTALAIAAPAALPAVGTILVTQALLNFAGEQVSQYAKSLDPNSPQNLIKKAFLYQDKSEDLKSILGKALLYLSPKDDVTHESVLDTALNYDIDIDSQTEHHSVLKDKLEDLSLVDAELKYADNTSLYIKGKVLQH